MTRALPSSRGRRPHVALLLETSMIAGRGMLRGIAQYARKHGLWSMYHEPRGLNDPPPAWLGSWRGDGIIARLSNARLANAVLKTGLPVVDTLGVNRYAGVPVVHPDDWTIGRMAAEHLLECGFRNFGYCGVRAVWSRRPREGFSEVVAAAGFSRQNYHLPLHYRTRGSWEREQERLTRWIRRLDKPAAILACSDYRGQWVLDACCRARVTVPDEVAVIGVGNDEMTCGFCDPPLSSVVPGHRQVGWEAARILDHLMQGGEAPRDPLFVKPLGVVTRQSSDVLAVEDPETRAAVRFIRDHAPGPLSVEDVVEHCQISRTELKRRFRGMLGRSVHDQIVRERIKRAKQLLADTELSLAEVARQAGFARQEYLGVVFKARVGKTPGRYRKELLR